MTELSFHAASAQRVPPAAAAAGRSGTQVGSMSALSNNVLPVYIAGTPNSEALAGNADNNIIEGGAGNDTINGGAGSDTYCFGSASGNDVIAEGADWAVNTDAVLFDVGIAPADVSVKRDGTGNTLLLTITGASNMLRINNYFYNNGLSPYALEQIRFADNTVWDLATVQAMVMVPTAGADVIVGYGGSDVLDGGAGDDWLDGRGGGDTYKFGVASGNDIIKDLGDSAGNADVILFDNGIAPGEVAAKRDGTSNALLLTIVGAGNVLRVENYFFQDGLSAYGIEQIRFADNTVWDLATVKAKVMLPTEGDDIIVGYGGSDVLDGGAGNDRLDGRGGGDTYKFGAASGNDVIRDYGESAGNADVILLDAGIAPADVNVKRDGTGNDLLLTIANAPNVLRVENYFFQDGLGVYGIEQIRFADTTLWDLATVKAKAMLPTAGDDIIVGYGGSDVLDGGAGNDRLDGRGGADTYKFGVASGNDVIRDAGDTSGNADVILFDNGIAPGEVVVMRDGTTNTLLLTIMGAGNVLRVENYFYQNNASLYAVEQIRFADNTVWDYSQVLAMLADGADGMASMRYESGAQQESRMALAPQVELALLGTPFDSGALFSGI